MTTTRKRVELRLHPRPWTRRWLRLAGLLAGLPLRWFYRLEWVDLPEPRRPHFRRLRTVARTPVR